MEFFSFKDTKNINEWRDKHNEASIRIVQGNSPDITELEGMDENDRKEYGEFMYDSVNNSIQLAKDISDVSNMTMFEYLGDNRIFIFASTDMNEGEISSLGLEAELEKEKGKFVSDYVEKGDYKTATAVFKSSVDGKKYLYVLVPVVENGKLLCLISGDYPWSDFRDSAVSGLIRYEYHSIIFRLAAILFQVILLFLTVVKPLKTVQFEIREYMESKKSDGVVKGLKDIGKRNDEIGGLAKDMTALSLEIDDYCEKIEAYAKEKAAIGAELSVATKKQADALPKTFPAFPDRKEFDLYADMNPALDVGGDFYDFFMIDDDHLALVIADVSDKGVPAALFMMKTQTMLEAITMRSGSGVHPKDIFRILNERLIEKNSLDMFVTVWMGILTISTGELACSNAGHEYPAIFSTDGNEEACFRLHKAPHSLPLAVYPGASFIAEDISLNKGDILFVYTDGVTEAATSDGELFGDERITDVFNRIADKTPVKIIEGMRDGIHEFVGDCQQCDDITMLCIKYNGPVD